MVAVAKGGRPPIPRALEGRPSAKATVAALIREAAVAIRLLC